MTRGAWRAASIVLCACLPRAPVAAASWPQLPVPPHTTVQWVAQQMEFNGVPMQIRTFRSRLSVQEMLDYYRARWSNGKRCDCVENSVGPYRQIARSEGPYFYTVQVRATDARSSEGYIGVTAPPAVRTTPGSGFPVPPATQVVNDIKADDGDTRSRTLLLQNRQPPAANAAYYEREMPQQGWRLAGRMQPRSGAQTLRYRREAQEATLVFAQHGADTVVGVTVVEHRFAGADDERSGIR